MDSLLWGGDSSMFQLWKLDSVVGTKLSNTYCPCQNEYISSGRYNRARTDIILLLEEALDDQIR